MPKFEFQRGLVPLSADPITNGHIDLIKKAKARCRKLFVIIMNNERKLGTYLFKIEERLKMASLALRDLHGVMVIASSGLLVDEYLRLGADVVWRGVRNKTDEEYENQQAAYNHMILPGYRVEYIPAQQQFEHVSSSLVKGFVELGIDVSRFVPLNVKAALEARIRGSVLIGVTGGISVGKSYVAQRLGSALTGPMRCSVYNINVDQLLHDVYAENSPGAKRLRCQIAELLGDDVLDDDVLNRAIMRTRLFGSDEANRLRVEVERITTPHVMRLLRARLKEAKGIVLLEWAQLVEMDMVSFVNNRVIVVGADDHPAFLEKRGLTPENIVEVSRTQLSVSEKVARIERKIEEDKYGDQITFLNSLNPKVYQRSMWQVVEWVRGLDY